MQKTELSVSDVMSHPVVSISPETRVREVFGLANERGIHHFPIVEGEALLAVVCTCDLRHARPESGVFQLAQRNVLTVSCNSSAASAAQLMSMNAVGSAIVTRGQRVCGIITREDLARAAPELASLIEEGHCGVCGVRKHLIAGPDGSYLCADCEDNARGNNWFDFGAGD